MNPLNEFLDLQKKENTKKYYELCLNKYFEAIKTKPDNYFSNGRDYEKDINKFIKTLSRYAPLTQKCYVSCIRNFFEYNEVDIKKKFWKYHVKKQIDDGYALTLDRKPTKAELRTILSYGDLKAKALFLTLASTGMRVSECLSINIDQLDLKSNPAMITIKSTDVKGKPIPRRVFVSDEAKELLYQWLNEGGRERYLKELDTNMTGLHKVDWDDKRIFPMKPSAVRRLWRRLLIKSGLNQKSQETNRYELHPHSFRKFFNSNMKLVIPDIIVEALMGHKKYLSESYSRYSLEEIKEQYLKGMHTVMVFETTPDLTETHQKIEELKNENKEKDKQIQKLTDMYQKLEAKITEKRIDRLEQNRLPIEEMIKKILKEQKE